MTDKKLRAEKKLNRYTYRKVKRVQSYGYGRNDKYRSKKESVCYWTQEGGNFVSYERSKIGKAFVRIRYKLRFWLPTKIWAIRNKEVV